MKAAQKKETQSSKLKVQSPLHRLENGTASPTAVGVLRVVAYEEIEADPNQPRKIFDEVKLRELADSIQAVGLQQDPIVVFNPPKFAVREPDLVHKGWAVIDLTTGEVAKGHDGELLEFGLELPLAESLARGFLECRNGKPYRIVAGERRWRAVGLLGWKELTVKVVEMSQSDIAAFQLVENMQREALDALEEAEGFQRILDHEKEQGLTVEGLAARLGKSRSSVYAKLNLLKLSEVAKNAYLEGKVDVSIAELISKIPDVKLQAKALKEILEGGETVYESDPGTYAAGNASSGPMSYRAARKHITQKYMLNLKDAPFDWHSRDLVPAAGSCVDCPFRSGNCREAHPHIKSENICTNPTCWNEKKAAMVVQAQSKARESGKVVVEGKDAKGLFSNYGQISSGAAYVGAEEMCWKGGESQRYRALMKGSGVKPVVAINPANGKVVELFPKAEVNKVLKQLGLDEERGKETPEQKAEREFQGKVAEATDERVQAAMIAALNKVQFTEKLEKFFLLTLAKLTMSYSRTPKLVKDAPLAKFTLTELRTALLVDALAENYGGEDEEKEWQTLLKVDPKKIEKEVRAELTAQTKEADSKRPEKKQAKKK